ncbi:pancreatic lipase-related protein 2-like [Trichogramma pretiosum]|uniref:pancreatic lipase-related protein 2-like n=1 Tax=Trichogramma pretiosum TaxID=7493 RepID=UPI000C718C24|nr:pancreatic lipase-related protein 2-like [Trichogramma pretiosum]
MKSVSFCCLVLFLSYSFGSEFDVKILCKDIRNRDFLGQVAYWTSTLHPYRQQTNFFVSSNKHRYAEKIYKNMWYNLINIDDGSFDPKKKTAIIIHGYRSGALNKWTIELKDKLLEAKLKDHFDNEARLGVSNRDTWQWNHLHFIGHSLGAHVSAQTAHLLKNDTFWHLDRITGLDPARPCFTQANSPTTLDKGDAAYVDVIHTQIGHETRFLQALGIDRALGHTDFYVSTGVKQLQCHDDYPLFEMICSHQASYEYFIATLEIFKNRDECGFPAYPWNGSPKDALEIVQEIAKSGNRGCETCPKMGIEAGPNSRKGVFLVISSSKKPYCEVSNRELLFIVKMTQKLKANQT